MGRTAETEAQHKERVQYLKDHPELWDHLPFPPIVIGRSKDKASVYAEWSNWKKTYNKPIVEAFKSEGLLKPTTVWRDVNVPQMLHEVKNEISSS